MMFKMRGVHMTLYNILVLRVVAATALATTRSNAPLADETSDEVFNMPRYSDTIIIPEYVQDNHKEMVLGARIAHGELNKISVDKSRENIRCTRCSDEAPTFGSWFPQRATSSKDQIRFVQDATNN
jgi:hypothetical protein